MMMFDLVAQPELIVLCNPHKRQQQLVLRPPREGRRTLTRNLVQRSKAGHFLVKSFSLTHLIPEKQQQKIPPKNRKPDQGGGDKGQRSAALCKFKSAVCLLQRSPAAHLPPPFFHLLGVTVGDHKMCTFVSISNQE